MANPRKFEIDLSSYGYHMEVDRRKSDCHRGETPHWHLWHGNSRVGSIDVYGNWADRPNVERRIEKEAEELTRRYAPTIREVFEYNRENGADY